MDYTYIRQYEISGLPGFEQGFAGTGVTDGAGTSGDGGTTLTSLPDHRGHLTFNWRKNNHNFTAINRYIGSYDYLRYDQIVADTNPLIKSLASPKVDSYSAWDVQYSFTKAWSNQSFGTTVFTLGVLDLFEEDLPYVETGGNSTISNYDQYIFDPRGRRLYFRALMQF